MHTEDFTIFSVDMNFARCLVTCPLLLWSLLALVSIHNKDVRERIKL